LNNLEVYLAENEANTIFLAGNTATIADFLLFSIVNDITLFDLEWAKIEYKRVCIWYQFCRQQLGMCEIQDLQDK